MDYLIPFLVCLVVGGVGYVLGRLSAPGVPEETAAQLLLDGYVAGYRAGKEAAQ